MFISDSNEPLLFDVEADDWDRDDPDEAGLFGHLTQMAEFSIGEDNDVFHFTDIDGEEAFFRGDDIAMIQIPLWVVDPDLLDAVNEEADDNSQMGTA